MKRGESEDESLVPYWKQMNSACTTTLPWHTSTTSQTWNLKADELCLQMHHLALTPLCLDTLLKLCRSRLANLCWIKKPSKNIKFWITHSISEVKHSMIDKKKVKKGTLTTFQDAFEERRGYERGRGGKSREFEGIGEEQPGNCWRFGAPPGVVFLSTIHNSCCQS